VPYISERNELENEMKCSDATWICGKFTQFAPKFWVTRKTYVTIRELRKNAGSDAVPDILIAELQALS